MLRITAFLILLTGLSGCMSNDGTKPFSEVETASTTEDSAAETETGTTDEDSSTGIATDGLAPPVVTVMSQNNSAIFASQGEADGYRYDASNDHLYINNLPFDGLATDPYTRHTQVPTTNSQFGIYKSVDIVNGAVGNGDVDIEQFPHRAIYGSSESGGSQVVIVKTGSYSGQGFGGYSYQRLASDLDGNDMGFTRPSSGQAVWKGGYQAMLVYSDQAGLHHVTGKTELNIDFDHFVTNPGVTLYITERQIFDDAGTDVTSLFDSNTFPNPDGTDSTFHQGIVSVVSTGGVLTANGEFSGDLTPSGNIDQGNFYGIISGNEASEAVGVVVVDWTDPLFSGSTVHETGGFIVTRQ